MCMLGLSIFFPSCWLPCLYICTHCYKLLTLKCTAFFVVPAPQYKQGSCVCASVLWFSICALYECVYSRPKTMALSDYISLSVEAVKGGRRHWLLLATPPASPVRADALIGSGHIYIYSMGSSKLTTTFKLSTRTIYRLECRSFKTLTSVGFYTSLKQPKTKGAAFSNSFYFFLRFVSFGLVVSLYLK